MTVKQSILKFLYPLFLFINRVFKKNDNIFSSDKPAIKSFYNLKTTLHNGEVYGMAQLKNKKVLIVNTASDCGFTPQYEALEKLYSLKKNTLEILAFPANDFKQQEMGEDHEIHAFCKKHYGISFPIMHKSKVVVHSAQNPVYEWLTDKAANGWNENEPTWNFCKYLIDEKGKLAKFFSASVKPMDQKILHAINS